MTVPSASAAVPQPTLMRKGAQLAAARSPALCRFITRRGNLLPRAGTAYFALLRQRRWRRKNSKANRANHAHRHSFVLKRRKQSLSFHAWLARTHLPTRAGIDACAHAVTRSPPDWQIWPRPRIAAFKQRHGKGSVETIARPYCVYGLHVERLPLRFPPATAT